MGLVSRYIALEVKGRDECSPPTCFFLDTAYLPVRKWTLPAFTTLFNVASSYHSIPFSKLLAVLLLCMYILRHPQCSTKSDLVRVRTPLSFSHYYIEYCNTLTDFHYENMVIALLSIPQGCARALLLTSTTS
ncbi:hypothetical protein HBH56_070600 [Parastagonospora nodorum]|uniref:Uncharacterized protein n=1 Tax=Phaeosphaeria nodorum (strain SN15 / ATCC MYA-4574 / FGSC 10173) TaxID=321614 RepID=A0A7U2HWY9_PHANO|nr:hypothetical protein HBH56_070600 [Parastagonospora nodorum]QRC93688.1 hypothetical protein JI435_404300 [Parastagonospora nodorum SN15]KAH3932514.1 hypothetical protein HBH54_077500 [Parastagonospora nodorum]KAH4143809.1 hypothetical protein HBH45_032530 [Parastagonospora nodorum]KAH4165870.1 hypothetical protein HBH44_070830 [Parastagonospora nodorum]